jgi:hypothetical protein
MATTLPSPTIAGTKAWQYSWTGTSPFRVEQEGKQLLVDSAQTSITVQNTDAEEYRF